LHIQHEALLKQYVLNTQACIAILVVFAKACHKCTTLDNTLTHSMKFTHTAQTHANVHTHTHTHTTQLKTHTNKYTQVNSCTECLNCVLLDDGMKDIK